MGYMDLSIYYKSIFTLAQSYNNSIEDVSELIPFERDLYLEMLSRKVEEMNTKARKTK